jgi:hypothetical protein
LPFQENFNDLVLFDVVTSSLFFAVKVL